MYEYQAPFEKKACLICGKIFLPRHKRHQFCKRKCFLIYNKNRNNSVGFPSYKCSFCCISTKLDFSPREHFNKFRNFKCPNCGKTPADITE